MRFIRKPTCVEALTGCEMIKILDSGDRGKMPGWLSEMVYEGRATVSPCRSRVILSEDCRCPDLVVPIDYVAFRDEAGYIQIWSSDTFNSSFREFIE